MQRVAIRHTIARFADCACPRPNTSIFLSEGVCREGTTIETNGVVILESCRAILLTLPYYGRALCFAVWPGLGSQERTEEMPLYSSSGAGAMYNSSSQATTSIMSGRGFPMPAEDEEQPKTARLVA